MSEAEPAIVGVNGLGWGATFKHLARDKEPVKHERDGRAPAGIFRFGQSFGFAPANTKDHLRLQPGVHFCVEDVRSPYYGHIVAKSKLGQKVSGEEMAAIDIYRRGLVIDYPRRRFAKAGSCIFLRVWESPDKGSSGRVGLARGAGRALPDLGQEPPHGDRDRARAGGRSLQRLPAAEYASQPQRCAGCGAGSQSDAAGAAGRGRLGVRRDRKDTRFEHTLERNARALSRYGLGRYFQKRS